MTFHEELLAQAGELVNKSQPGATQADLRRAVSAAYYALFHLLVSEATLNWKRDSSRYAFGRMFDHGLMRKASQRMADSNRSPMAGEDSEGVRKLRKVAKGFVQLQQKRHLADYDNGTRWTPFEALQEVSIAREAFAVWATIRSEDLAQEYLVPLLIRPRE